MISRYQNLTSKVETSANSVLVNSIGAIDHQINALYSLTSVFGKSHKNHHGPVFDPNLTKDNKCEH